MPKQTDLWGSYPTWLADPMKGFGAFIQSTEFVELGKHGKARQEEGRPVHPIAKSSQQIYCHMFGNFCRWMQGKRLGLHQIGEAEIREFLDIKHQGKGGEGKKLNSLIRVRYVRLLERVFTHLGVQPNPATKAAYAVHKSAATGRDKPKAYLSEKQQAILLMSLPEPEPFEQDNPFAPSWKRRRDRAMLAVMLGAGLRVSEVMALQITHVGKKDAAGCVPITVVHPGLKTADNAHRTLLRPFAAAYVLPWIEERRLHPAPGKLLFPASLKTGKALNKATVYRHVKHALDTAGITITRMGGRTLRNSFAIRELQHETPVEVVGQFMGHVERRSTEKYIVPTAQKNLDT